MVLGWALLVLSMGLAGGSGQQAAAPAIAPPVVAPPVQEGTPATSAKVPVEGSVLFQTKGCTYCHGADAGGVVGKGPSLKNIGATRTSAELYRQIHDGGMEMPPFADALTEDEMQGLVGYLSQMKLPVAKTPAKRKKR